MSRTRILKYQLSLGTSEQVLPIAVVRHLGVGFQNGVPVLWAEVREGEIDRCRIAVRLTGDEPPEGESEHLGTAQVENSTGAFVMHVYRLHP